MKHLLSAVLTIILVPGLSYTAAAQTEVTVIGPGGVRAVVEKLIPGFEAKTGYKVKPTYGSGGGTHAQVVKGDVFDVVIVQPPLIYRGTKTRAGQFKTITSITPPRHYFFESSRLKRLSTSSRLSGFFALVNKTE
jgi:hypothetical protein